MAIDANNAESIKSAYSGYAGWNDPNAIISDFKATGGSGKGGPMTSDGVGMSGDYSSALNEAIKQQQAGVNQSVSALQGQQSLLSQQTAQKQAQLNQQQSTLQQRYDSLINDIKGQGQQQVNRQTNITSQELANRGISLQGNLGQQEIANALNPINQQTQTNLTNTGIAREQDMFNITNLLNQAPLDEQSQRLAIQAAIGQLQSGAGGNAVSTALQLLQNQQNQQQQQFANTQSTKFDDLERQLREAQINSTNTSAANQTAQAKAQQQFADTINKMIEANKRNQYGTGFVGPIP